MGIHLSGSSAAATRAYYAAPGSYLGGEEENGTHALVLDDGHDRFVVAGDPAEVHALGGRIRAALNQPAQTLQLD